MIVSDSEGNLSILSSETTGMQSERKSVSPRVTWLHLLVTLLYFLVIAAGQVIYDHWIEIAGDEWIAWVANLLIGLAASILFLFFCLIWTDVAVFGYTKKYLEGTSMDLNVDTIKQISSETRWRVVWTIAPIAAFHFIGNFAIGGTRLLTPDVDHNWLACVGYFAGLLILLIIVYFIVAYRFPRVRKCSAKGEKIDDSGDYYQRTTSIVPSSTDSTCKRSFNDSLGQHFLQD
jgi:hypothetical protein